MVNTDRRAFMSVWEGLVMEKHQRAAEGDEDELRGRRDEGNDAEDKAAFHHSTLLLSVHLLIVSSSADGTTPTHHPPTQKKNSADEDEH